MRVYFSIVITKHTIPYLELAQQFLPQQYRFRFHSIDTNNTVITLDKSKIYYRMNSIILSFVDTKPKTFFLMQTKIT
jgi:hypothetical protein